MNSFKTRVSRFEIEAFVSKQEKVKVSVRTYLMDNRDNPKDCVNLLSGVE